MSAAPMLCSGPLGARNVHDGYVFAARLTAATDEAAKRCNRSGATVQGSTILL